MKIDRLEIEQILLTHLEKVLKSRKIKHQLQIQLIELNVPVEDINSIFSNVESVSNLDVSMLYGLTKALYVVTEDEEIDPDRYFGKREIKEAENILSQSVQERITLPIHFEECTKIKFDSYITKISIQTLVKLYDSQLIIYDDETQRGVNYKTNKSGGIVRTPIVNKASVKRIADKMASNSYFEDMITLNVFSSEVNPVTYKEESNTLTINEGAVITILDGFHRLQGGVLALQINPHLNLELILSIRSYDHEIAQKYFGQINTVNVLKKERREELAQERLSDKVVANLQRKSEIGKQIASSTKVSELVGELTTFDILSYSVDKVFKLKRQFDVLQISDYLIEFFAYLAGSYPDEFSINIKLRGNHTMSHPLMFIGYIVLSHYMYENKIPLQKLSHYIDSIDLEDEKLLDLLNKKNILTGNKRIRENIIKYFDYAFRGVQSE
ncbi:DNA sulfur modification protein DndB [Paenibacillus polysaccharolyticus]|uniref:DNA sulfur modification protein DndB n=1 Tax=Paenibacillus polysaccharolyticus TaxID=582692 RepID=UPI0030092829